MLDQALTRAGHRSIVVAAQGSRVQGTLYPVAYPTGEITVEARAHTWALTRQAVAEALNQCPTDVIHMHGIDFLEYLPPEGKALLATLHLPLSWYPESLCKMTRPKTWMHCVSVSQSHSAPPALPLLKPIANGVSEDLPRAGVKKQKFALSLGRICPEKGYHIALEAAQRARSALLIGRASVCLSRAPALLPRRGASSIGWEPKIYRCCWAAKETAIVERRKLPPDSKFCTGNQFPGRNGSPDVRHSCCGIFGRSLAGNCGAWKNRFPGG